MIFTLLISTIHTLGFNDAAVGEALKNDVCLKKSMETLSPKVNKAISEKNYGEMTAAFNEVRGAIESCQVSKSLTTDPLKNAGIALLLASNCFKDLGAVLLILDSVVVDPSDVPQDVIVAIFLGIMGLQARKDCGQFIHFL
jgi:hypothetical protein